MQKPSSSKYPPLDHLHPSPVKGQLQAHDTKTAKGWRYIQTTDTLNQFKVLLPPGTASMYEQLLKFEDYELRKGSALSWERIQEIRHLKDRMIRKCQKLTKAHSSGEALGLSFSTVVAPADFRVKEMEKWFLDQHKRSLTHMKDKRRERGAQLPCKCSKCIGPPQNGTPTPRKHSNAFASASQPDRASQLKVRGRDLSQQSKYPFQLSAALSAAKKSENLPPQPTSGTATPPSALAVSSPPPLPHLLRIRNSGTDYDLSADPQEFSPLSAELRIADFKSSSLESGQDPVKPNESTSAAVKSVLHRRSSCLKRSSTGDFSKRVSWADGQDLEVQVSKYTTVAREAQASGRKWEEFRDTYLEQMSGLEALHQQVEQSLGHLRSESEHLKRADETIRLQREMLQSTFQEFERKQLLFQAKVQEALDDVDQVLSLTPVHIG